MACAVQHFMLILYIRQIYLKSIWEIGLNWLVIFNIYADDLSHMLNSIQDDRTIKGVIYHHLIFTDDTVLITFMSKDTTNSFISM